MSEFNFNYSRLNEDYNIPLTKELIHAIRVQARILLIPFFRKVAIRHTYTDKGIKYPVLTDLAERIIQSVFYESELDYDSMMEAHENALAYLTEQKEWQKSCLSFYFCSDEIFLKQLDEENQDSNFFNGLQENDWEIEIGKQVQKASRKLMQNENALAGYLTKELIHLQDIFSTESISWWNAEAIANANENFEEYAGIGQVLIPLPLTDFDYWESIMREEDDEKDEEDEEDNEDKEEDENENDN